MRILIIITFLISSQISYSKVDPPNYNFSLDTLSDFMPKTPLEAIEKKYGKGIKVAEQDGAEVHKFYVSHIRYKFPVFVQLKNKIVGDFFAKLPTYFLHDVFHQSIINKIGKQDKYLKKENSAVYIWNNINGNTVTYSGSCTITCFPSYYSIFPAGSTDNLLSKFSKLTSSDNK